MNSSSSFSPNSLLSGRPVLMDGTVRMVKIKACSGCSPSKMLEVRMSNSVQNHRRLYYKCRFCEEFGWVEEDDVIRGGYDVKKHLDLAHIKGDLDSMWRFIKAAIKLGFFMYCVILAIVVAK